MVRGAVVHAILFIAVVSAAALFAGMMVTETTSYADAIEGEGERTAAAHDAEITFVDDPEAGTVYDGTEGRVRLHLKNVGGDALVASDLELLIDGEPVEPEATVLDPDHDRWRVATVLELTVDRTLDPGDHRALATIHGQQAALEFSGE